MFIHNLDPFIFDFGFFAVRWYSLAYILGIFIGWWYGKKIISNLPEKSKGNLKLLNIGEPSKTTNLEISYASKEAIKVSEKLGCTIKLTKK